MIVKLAILAALGGIIGWMTNVIAIKLLFRPIDPIKIPLLPFQIQGLIPKRKGDIAKSIGETIEDELISIEKILDKMIEKTDKVEILNLVKDKILRLADEKMPAAIPSIFKQVILKSVGEMIDQNGEEMIIEMTEALSHKAIESIDISNMVEEQLNQYDFEKLEEMTLRIAKRELKGIEILGGVIGIFIGLIQGIVVLVLL